jgi:DNA-binding XRE family transcriptional regulator
LKIFYDHDRNYAEIFFKRAENYASELSRRVTVFRAEKSDEIVGYAFEFASKTLFDTDLISSSAKLAALLKIIRAKEGLTQEQAAERIHPITFRHYQRLESGEENPTLATIESLMLAFPGNDFSVILKPKPRAA